MKLFLSPIAAMDPVSIFFGILCVVFIGRAVVDPRLHRGLSEREKRRRVREREAVFTPPAG